MSHFVEPGSDKSIDELLAMLTDKSALTGVAAAQRLDSLYPNVPTGAIIAVMQKETLYNPVLSVLFPLLRRYDVHVSRDILLAVLRACEKDRNVELLHQLEWEIVSLGPMAPIEELLRMLIECNDNLYPFYKDFFTQLGHMLGMLSEWVTPEKILAASHAEDQRTTIDLQYMAIDILGALKDFLPIASKLIMNVLEDSQREREIRAHAIFTLAQEEVGEIIPLPYLLLGLDWCYQGIQEITVEMLTRLGEHAPIQKLIALLDDDNNWTRGSIVSALCNLAQYVPIPLLVDAIRYGSPWMREGAACVLGACGDRAPIPLLMALAHNKHEGRDVRGAALMALGRLGKRVSLDAFLEAVQDEQDFMRDYAIYALLERGKNATLDELPALLDVLVIDVDLRHELISIVSAFEEPAVVKLLMSVIAYKRLYQPDTDIPSDPVIAAMSQMLKQRLHSSPEGAIPSAFAALSMLRKYVQLDSLIPHLCDDRGKLPGSTVDALITIGKYDSLEAVIANLDTISKDTRAYVVDILGKLGEHAPLDVLLRLLDDHDSERQLYVNASLALYELAKIMPAKIIARTYDDPRYYARIVLLIALEHAGEEAPDEAIALAKEFLSDKQLFGHALALLNRLGRASELPLEFLLQALHRDGPRQIVLEALEQFGSRVPLDVLLPFFGDQDEAVYEAAARTVAKTHPTAIQSLILPQVEAILRGEPAGGIFAASVQRRIAYKIGWMERVTPPLMDMLVELLDYPYWQVRLEAVRALGKIPQTIPQRALVRLMELRSDPQSQTMREVADEALAAILARDSEAEDA